MRVWLCTTAFALATAVAAQAQTAAPAAPGTAQIPSYEQCAKGWDTVDADRNGTLSEAEATQATDVTFARLDFDADGVITQGEWRNCGVVGLRNWGRGE